MILLPFTAGFHFLMATNGWAMRSAGFRSTKLSTYFDVYFMFIFSILLLNPALRMSLCWGYVLSSFLLFFSALARHTLLQFLAVCRLVRIANVYGFCGGFYFSIFLLSKILIISRIINTIVVRSISNQYLNGSTHISVNMFHRPRISTKFQKIITVGIEYFIA